MAMLVQPSKLQKTKHVANFLVCEIKYYRNHITPFHRTYKEKVVRHRMHHIQTNLNCVKQWGSTFHLSYALRMA